MKKEIMQTSKIVVLGLLLALGVNIVSAAWTAPPANPPNENTSAPINVGSSAQTKTGRLIINSPVNTGLVVMGGTQPIQILDSSAGDDAGKVLTADSMGYASWQSISTAAQPHGYVVLSTPGSGSWTVPANVTSVEVHVVGGGAAGVRQGGQGGGYATAIRTVTPGQQIAYQVGTGGTAACDTVANGSNTVFDTGAITGATITAYGGNGALSINNPVIPPVSTTLGSWNGGDWGAHGHSWLDRGVQVENGDKPPGFSSGFPYSRGGGSTTNLPQTSTQVLPTYGGGGNGDTDATGGYCGGNGANGIIVVKY